MSEFSCTDINGVSVSQFVFNDDGTVSGIIATGGTVSDPTGDPTGTIYQEAVGAQKRNAYTTKQGTTESPISEECCNALNFTWEPSTNTCYWTETCETSSPDFKVVMGAQGNEGAFFQVDENETCQLTVKFNYLFQFDCDTLRACVDAGTEENGELGDLEDQIGQTEEQIDQYNDTIDSLIEQQQQTNDAWNDAIEDTNTQIAAQQQKTKACQDQLEKTQDAKSKTQDEQALAVLEQREMASGEEFQKNTSALADLERTKAEQEKNRDDQNASYDKTIEEYQQAKGEAENQLTILKNEGDKLTGGTTDNPELATTTDCLSIFENLDVAVTLDKVVQRTGDTQQVSYESVQTLENVYTADLYKIDDIVQHFSGNCNTGLYVTGSSRCLQQLNQCISDNLSGDCGVLSACTLNSDWLTYEFEINDLETLSGITNEQIKLGFLVRNCECDFNILVDRIEINKRCTEIEKEEIFVSKCPSFEIERVCDNKKSWVVSEERQEREYFVKGRETDYDINHHKLAINTKEIDLEVSPATAIETDVWCYLTDNPSLLECSTGTTSVTIDTDIDFNAILTAQTFNCDSGATEESCTVISTWGINVELECETIYTNASFYNGTGFNDAPTQDDYVTELSNIALALGLDFTTGDTGVIFTDTVDCSGTTFVNNNFKVDLLLDITTDCEVEINNKQFQDGTPFDFQDGTPFDFN